jgi:hypothetical protein
VKEGGGELSCSRDCVCVHYCETVCVCLLLQDLVQRCLFVLDSEGEVTEGVEGPRTLQRRWCAHDVFYDLETK